MELTPLLIGTLALALPMLWWLMRRRAADARLVTPEERVDTLAAWPPEATRVLRSSERLAYSTLKLALPGYLILAQVPVSRFVNVPKRVSYAEWMRRLGSQCVDFLICDVTSQVVAVVEIRAPLDQIDERLRTRLARVERTLKAAQIPMHIWTESALPTVEAARAKILPHSPAVPARLSRRALDSTPAHASLATSSPSMQSPHAADARAAEPFDEARAAWPDSEVIEVSDPSATSWFDELDSAPGKLTSSV